VRRSRSRTLPDSVRRAVLRQHPDAFNVPASKPYEREAIEPVQLVGNGAPGWKGGKQRKYKNEPATDPDTGERFDSKLEMRVWKALVAKYGERNVMRQVSIMLPGGIRMRPDFIVLGWIDAYGNSTRTWDRVIDAKGMPPTSDWNNKKKLLKATFGLECEIIRKPSEV
jgi:hypothetical protein